MSSDEKKPPGWGKAPDPSSSSQATSEQTSSKEKEIADQFPALSLGAPTKPQVKNVKPLKPSHSTEGSDTMETKSSPPAKPTSSKVAWGKLSTSTVGGAWGNTAPPPPINLPAPAVRKPVSAPVTPQQQSSSQQRGRGRTGGGTARGKPKGGGGGEKKVEKVDRDLVENQKEIQDFVVSRPSVEGVLQSKKGKQGRSVELYTNYYPLNKLTNFNLFHFHVEFKPNEERTQVRKKLVSIHEPTLGAFIFDGQALYSPNRIQIPYLYSMNTYNRTKTQITLKLVSEVSPVDPVFLQVYNITFRNLLTSLSMELMGRFYYDPSGKTSIPSRKLEIWPGYITSVRNHENQVMLNLEVTHKVVRSDSVLDFIENTKRSVPAHMDYKRDVTKQLLGAVVVTTYNRKNYKIDDIKWDVSPKDTFQMKGGEKKSYIDYYKETYGTIIKDIKQPMLVSLPKKKDYHRGSSQPIYLVPEICQMTGMTDQMRADVNLMKDLARFLIMSPAVRVQKANALLDRLYKTPKVVKELKLWNIQISKEPQKCVGRVVDLEELIVGPGAQGLREGMSGPIKVKQDKPGEWPNLFRNRSMLSTVKLNKWVVLIPPNAEHICNQMLEAMKGQARSMNFNVTDPIKITMRDTKPHTYASTIHSTYTHLRNQVQLFLILLPSNSQDTYSAIKKKCSCELGVASQCVILKTLQSKNLVSVTNRIAIQINSKLGGEPWTVDIPLREIMIIGYDVFHSPSKNVRSVGAMLASTSPTVAKYFTAIQFHTSRNELSSNLCTAMIGALCEFRKLNPGRLPARIFLYRDGVGDGQLTYIHGTELPQILEAIRSVYQRDSYPPAKFSFIVVTKRIHSRIFRPSITGSFENPEPGTVVDDVITLPERYDFFMAAQTGGNQGTVSPTSYNILFDEQNLDPDKIQRLTYKLCHLYFNYSGTIGVPAPCQYAHKLAYQAGMAMLNPAHPNLQNHLYFL